MNNVVLVGNITKDLELKEAGNTSVCNFSIAVKRDFAKEGQQDTDFINIVCFGKSAENLCKYQSKGNRIGVVGSLQIDQYKDNEGNNKTFTKVKADKIEFLQSKGEKQESSQDNQTSFQPIDEDDIPF